MVTPTTNTVLTQRPRYDSTLVPPQGRRDLLALPALPSHEELAQVQIDATSAWPPRATLSPINILAIIKSDRFFVAQIPIRVNKISILALVDTGAAITVTSQQAAPLFGVFSSHNSVFRQR